MHTVEGSHRRSAALVVLAVIAALLGGGAVNAHAQLGGPLPTIGGGSRPTTTTTTTTTSAAPRPQPSTTTTTSPGLVPSRPNPSPAPGPSPSPAPSPGPAPAPAPSDPGAPPPSGSPSSEPVPPGGNDGVATKGRGGIPAELQAKIDSVRRTPANNTRALLAALAPLGDRGLDETQRAMVGFGRFPIAAEANWSDDWWFPRYGPGWRLHMGIDIFAPYGSPVRAPVDGRIRLTNGGLGGMSTYVVQPDGTYWYMTHLSARPPEIVEGLQVTTGQIVGFVGTSGNAAGGKPHLHLEIHPRGGPAVPPKPVIDRFVSDAMARVPQLLAAYAQAHVAGQAPPTPAAAAATIAAPLPEPELELTTLSPRAAMLWASASNPAGGTLRLAEADAMAAAQLVDWDAVAAAAQRKAQHEADIDLWLAPLVPEALGRAIGLRY